MPHQKGKIRVKLVGPGSGRVETEAADENIGKVHTKLEWIRKRDSDPNSDPGLEFTFHPVNPLVFPAGSPFTVENIGPRHVTVRYDGYAADAQWRYKINVVDAKSASPDHIRSDGTATIKNH
jgi:hypothetical protein